MSPEEEYQLREDVSALLKERVEMNSRLDFLEEHLTTEAKVLLRRNQALGRIEDRRGR